jgi:hypothetical protein
MVLSAQAACFARVAGKDSAQLRVTSSLAETALQLQPDNQHYVSVARLMPMTCICKPHDESTSCVQCWYSQLEHISDLHAAAVG